MAPHYPLTLLLPLHPATLLSTSGDILSRPFPHISTISTILLNPISARLSTQGGANKFGKKKDVV